MIIVMSMVITQHGICNSMMLQEDDNLIAANYMLTKIQVIKSLFH